MTCPHCRGVDKIFDQGTAERDLRTYRARGPGTTTRLLIAALKAAGVADLTLLDIGGGVGAIQHELLAAYADGRLDAIHEVFTVSPAADRPTVYAVNIPADAAEVVAVARQRHAHGRHHVQAQQRDGVRGHHRLAGRAAQTSSTPRSCRRLVNTAVIWRVLRKSTMRMSRTFTSVEVPSDVKSVMGSTTTTAVPRSRSRLHIASHGWIDTGCVALCWM